MCFFDACYGQGRISPTITREMSRFRGTVTSYNRAAENVCLPDIRPALHHKYRHFSEEAPRNQRPCPCSYVEARPNRAATRATLSIDDLVLTRQDLFRLGTAQQVRPY